MSEAKHTPGPWEVKGYNIIWSSTAKTAVAIFLDADWPRGNRPSSPEANARLIAAAPENLQSNSELATIVRELCAAYEHPLPEDALARSDAAIAKATGCADSGQAAQGVE